MTKQSTLNIGFEHQPQLQMVYETNLNLHNVLMSGITIAFWRVMDTYRNTGTAMDNAIETLKRNHQGVLAVTTSPRSNDPIEG